MKIEPVFKFNFDTPEPRKIDLFHDEGYIAKMVLQQAECIRKEQEEKAMDEFWMAFDERGNKNPYKYVFKPITFDMRIEKVIFNEPATIVIWKDGTKTVVKASPDEPFDPEKGLAMAISKKALGNKGNYYNVFKKPLEEYGEKEEISSEPMKALDELAKSLRGGRKK